MAEKKKDKSDQILIKLGEHDRKFIEHDKKFDAITKKLEQHDKQFEGITGKLEEHDRIFGEFRNKFSDILTGQDKIIKELEIAREDRVLAIGKDREQDRRLDGLENRTQKVEAKV